MVSIGLARWWCHLRAGAAGAVGRCRGPFTGRQLTAVIVAFIVAFILLPGTVWAVDSFTNVAIQDPATGAKASVDAKHHVLVGTGGQALAISGGVQGATAAAGESLGTGRLRQLVHLWFAHSGSFGRCHQPDQPHHRSRTTPGQHGPSVGDGPG